MELTFDSAIELLEITDISKIKVEDIPLLEKKLKKRWHPDRVSHLNDAATTEEYTIKFQQIEFACEMIRSYLNGTYHAGEAFTQYRKNDFEEPEEIIRNNAPEMQQTLRDLWNLIKEKKYKWTEKETILSDGFKLKELLQEDFKEDLAMLSVVSFYYGLVSLGLLSVIGYGINPVLGTIISIIWMLQAISCVLGFIPLSRFWLPGIISEVMLKFINFGLAFYNWAEARGQASSNIWVVLLIRIPVLFAKLIKYVILFPLTELAKSFVGDKVVGVVKQKVNYYADAADWYIEELINAHPDEMSSEELFHLSYIYSELSDVKAKTWENSSSTFTKEATPENPPQAETYKTSDSRFDEHPPVEKETPVQPHEVFEEDFINNTKEPAKDEDKEPVLNEIFEEDHPPPKRERKKTVVWAAAVLILICAGLAVYLLFFNSSEITARASHENNETVQDPIMPDKEITTLVNEPVTDSSIQNIQIIIPVADSFVSTKVNMAEKSKDSVLLNPVVEQTGTVNTVREAGFLYLTKNQIKNDLLNKLLCEGLTYTGLDQKLSIIGAIPGIDQQRIIGLYGTIRIRVAVIDETENKSCQAEMIYKKDRNKFELENYIEK